MSTLASPVPTRSRIRRPRAARPRLAPAASAARPAGRIRARSGCCSIDPHRACHRIRGHTSGVRSDQHVERGMTRPALCRVVRDLGAPLQRQAIGTHRNQCLRIGAIHATGSIERPIAHCLVPITHPSGSNGRERLMCEAHAGTARAIVELLEHTRSYVEVRSLETRRPRRWSSPSCRPGHRPRR